MEQRTHTHTESSLEALVVIVSLFVRAFQAVFTPWPLLEGLIPRNPIRLSSFPQTAILALLAQAGASFLLELHCSSSPAIQSPGPPSHRSRVTASDCVISGGCSGTVYHWEAGYLQKQM